MILSGQRGPFLIRCSAAAAQAVSCLTAPNGAQVYVLAAAGRHAEKYDIEQIGAGVPLPGGACALKVKD